MHNSQCAVYADAVLSCRCLALLMSSLYIGLLYGLHVPDWEINMSNSGLSLPAANGTNIYKVSGLQLPFFFVFKRSLSENMEQRRIELLCLFVTSKL